MNRLPASVCLVTVATLMVGSAWAQQRQPREDRSFHAQPVPQEMGPLPPQPGFDPNARMRQRPAQDMNAGYQRRGEPDRAGKMACLNRVNLPPEAAVLAINQMEFEGGTQCRVKVMRPNGVVQVISALVEP